MKKMMLAAVAISLMPQFDSVSPSHDDLQVFGQVSLSLDSKYAVVESNGKYYRFHREYFSLSDEGLLDRPGTFVSVRAPPEALDMVWEVPKSEPGD